MCVKFELRPVMVKKLFISVKFFETTKIDDNEYIKIPDCVVLIDGNEKKVNAINIKTKEFCFIQKTAETSELIPSIVRLSTIPNGGFFKRQFRDTIEKITSISNLSIYSIPVNATYHQLNVTDAWEDVIAYELVEIK